MPEPAPISTPQSEPVWAFLKDSDLLLVDNSRLLYALEERVDFGRDKYGTVLQTHNGRDALQDAREELLDLVFYTAQAYLEGKLTYARWQDSLESVLTLWRALGGA